MMDGIHLDQFAVTGSVVPDHPLNIDNMAAMDADEPAAVEPGFDIADGQRAKQLVVAVENVGVMRVGVNGDHLVDRDETGGAIPLDRELARESPLRRPGAPERCESAAPQFWLVVSGSRGA